MMAKQHTAVADAMQSFVDAALALKARHPEMFADDYADCPACDDDPERSRNCELCLATGEVPGHVARWVAKRKMEHRAEIADIAGCARDLESENAKMQRKYAGPADTPYGRRRAPWE